MKEILAYSLDGCLRIRQTSKTHAQVELRSHLYPGSWGAKKYPIDYAWKFFHAQCKFHDDPHGFTQPIVQPGV